jgi:hypothetical protein
VEADPPYIQNVLLFKVLKNGNTTWSYQKGPFVAEAYALAGDAPSTEAPNALFPGEANQSGVPLPAVYSQTPIAVGAGVFCTATITNNQQDVTPAEAGFPGAKGLAVGFFNEALYHYDETAYSYMVNSKSICACGFNDCGC